MDALDGLRRVSDPLDRRLPRRAWDWAYGLLPSSDRAPLPRFLRAVRRGPKDFFLERASWPGMLLDVVLVASLSTIGLPFGTVLAIDWAAGEIPGVINFGRALAHRNPKAAPQPRWKWLWTRDWTYWTRPGARQAEEVSHSTEESMEVTSEKTPRWLQWIARQAKERGKPSFIAYFDDWINERSRVLSFAVEKSFLLAGLFVGIPWLALFLTNDIVVTRIPNAVSWWQAIRNHDLRRVTRPGIWQRPGDVVMDRSAGDLDLRSIGLIGRGREGRTTTAPMLRLPGDRLQAGLDRAGQPPVRPGMSEVTSRKSVSSDRTAVSDPAMRL